MNKFSSTHVSIGAAEESSPGIDPVIVHLYDTGFFVVALRPHIIVFIVLLDGWGSKGLTFLERELIDGSKILLRVK